ncbi:MAG: hydrogenase maturation protease [Candidatus Electrothrix sp. MAN1_4]|nr:hydrogenase maturation protease [Candidatus Electrothrix sp. MAN1_4]
MRIAKVTIAGAGNWLMAKDQIGPKVIEAIIDRYGPNVEVRNLGSSPLTLLDLLYGQELLVVIDAAVIGEPGAVRCYEPDLDNEEYPMGGGIHQIGPLETLLIARRLYKEILPERIFFITVATNNFDEKLEQETCCQVVKKIDNLLADWSIFPVNAVEANC